jgi:hypothetical protein
MGRDFVAYQWQARTASTPVQAGPAVTFLHVNELNAQVLASPVPSTGPGTGAPTRNRCDRREVARYFTRFATSSSVAKSATLRVNLISSAETIVPV